MTLLSYKLTGKSNRFSSESRHINGWGSSRQNKEHCLWFHIVIQVEMMKYI